jgi:predicted Zn-dependent protease
MFSPAMGLRPLALAASLLAASCAPAKQAWSEAEPRRAEVFLDVLPRNAEVRVDGAARGAGPVTLKLGEASVRVEVGAAGFEPRELAIDPRTLAGARVGVVLRPVGFGAGRPLEIDEAGGLAAAGAWLLRAGRPLEAEGYAERAVEASPNAAEPRKVLGLALAKQGKRSRAAQELSAYIQLAPSAPDRAEMEVMVARLRGDIAIPPPRD